MTETNVGFEHVIRVFNDGRAFALCAEHGRLVLYEEKEGEPRRELGALGGATRSELASFFRALREALAPNPRETLASDHGPLEPFQPPPEER